jgi:hypothetical protein
MSRLKARSWTDEFLNDARQAYNGRLEGPKEVALAGLSPSRRRPSALIRGPLADGRLCH